MAMSSLMTKNKILVVDDSEMIRVAHSSILSSVNAQVDVANSGGQALALLANEKYAVILMDIQMPGMTGFECVSIIRQNPDTQHIPIIFISAQGNEKQFVDKGYHLGAVDYMIKPIDPDRLISKVNVFITLFEQRAKLEVSLAEAKAIQYKNDQLLNYMAEGILGLDTNNVITFANIAACTLLTSNREQVVGRSIKDFVNPASSQKNWDSSEFNSIFKDGQCNHIDDALFWRNKNETFPVEYTQASILQNNQFVGGVVAFQDITERKKDQQKLLNLARYDQLTQLPNRSMYWDFLTKSIASCERTDNNIAVLFLDLDNFKQVNDSLGHDAGDELLIQVAKTLKHCVREADIVARVGGDEFAVLLLNPRDSQVAATVAQKIIEDVAKPFPIFSNEVTARMSIGISVYPDNGQTATQLTKAADTAMYHAKASGRNTFKYFSREMHERIQFDMKITQELNKAINRDELSIHFQPQINAHNHNLVGFEALIRWNHPDLGKVGPSRFIPVAESNGLITDIGDWCLLQALRQAKAWNDQMPASKKINMAVNVSSLQFKQHSFAKHIIHLVEQSGLPPKHLELEITETAIMENPKQTIEEIHKIREAGIRVSMDDFGTGYSSLAQLKELPIDVLKIDKSFIDEINQSKSGNAIVSSIIDLAHSMEIAVVAEGVESLPQFDFLQKNNCDIVQGYYFSKPLDKANSTEFLRRTIH
jgi:diguanylate cyclase (GGDEF)-like protein/PAS domain S-box-containing protein